MVRSVVEGGLSHAAAARQFNTTPKTVAKWVKRFRTFQLQGDGPALHIYQSEMARNFKELLFAIERFHEPPGRSQQRAAAYARGSGIAA